MGYMNQVLGGGGGVQVVRAPLVLMAVGNSVVDSYGSYDETSKAFFPSSAPMWACALSEGVTVMRRLSGAATYYDRYGNVGHGGATLATITGDLSTSGWLTQLRTDGVVPDIIMACALLENNIMQGQITSQCLAELDAFIGVMGGLIPGAIVWLGAPLPSFGYDTADKRAVAWAVRDGMIARASAGRGRLVFVDQGAGYRGGDYLPTALRYVEESTAPGTGTVHPQPAAASIIGAEWAAEISRRYIVSAYALLSSHNPALIGSADAAAGGSGVTGTKPTGATFSLEVPANNTITSVALNPGWRVTFAQAAVNGTGKTSNVWCGVSAITALSGSSAEGYLQFVLESGADRLIGFTLAHRLFYSDGTNEFTYGVMVRSTDVLSGHGTSFANGQRVAFRSPAVQAASGKTIASVMLYLVPTTADSVGALTLRIEALGLLS